jgi:hypothetical protein
LKPEVQAVSEPYPAECSNAKHSNPSTESTSFSAFPFLPITTPPLNISTLPESNSEPVPAKEVNNKKVRINAIAEVKQISESGLVPNSAQYINRGPEGEDKLNRPGASERIENNKNEIKNTSK